MQEERTHPVVTVIITVDAGLSREGEYCGSGISHFLEHMAFKGTDKRKPLEIEEEVKSYGGVINASTSLDTVNYYITVPREYAEESLSLMEDILFHPVYDAEELEKEKEVILKEIKLNNDDPSRRVTRNLWQAAYVKHLYGKPVIGEEEFFKKLAREDLITYHKNCYVPENIIVTVVGDIDKNETIREAKNLFGKEIPKRSPPPDVPSEPEQNAARAKIESLPINLAYLAMGYHTVEFSSEDLYALDALGIILGDWEGSRLNEQVVKQKELLYAASSFNYTPKYPGLFIVYGTGDYRKINKAKEEILKIIDEIAVKGVSDTELNAAKNMVISSYIDSLETTSGLASAISGSEYLAGDPTFFEKYVGNVKKVTNREIKEAAKKYLRGNNLTVSVLYPEYAVLGDEESIKTNAVGNKVAGYVRQGQPSFFKVKVAEYIRRRLSPVGFEVGGRTISADANLPKRITLPNGIRLILKEDHRLPKASLVCAFLGGVRVENGENNGISNLTSAMLLKGTKKRKESEIRPFIESQGGHISHFSGNNTFGISMSFLSERGGEALDLLADVIKNPSFPEEEIRKEKNKLFAAIKSQDDDIYEAGFLKLRKALFREHPYGLRVIGEKTTLEKITRGDLENFHKKFCVPNNMVISCVGDFDSRRMREEIKKRFAPMEKAALKIEAENPRPLALAKNMDYNMPKEQSLVATGFPGTTFTDRDKYSLGLLSSILSGENGRLYKTIRNEAGLAYALGMFSAPGIDAGYIASYAATDRKNIERAKEILLEELKAAKESAFSEKEVTLAKSSLIGRHKISLQTNSALAHQIALDELYGIGYNDYLDYEAHIQGVTMEDIINASKRYIDLEKSATVTIWGE